MRDMVNRLGTVTMSSDSLTGGGRDHTTIMHGIRKIEELVIEDHALAEDVNMLRRLLEA